MDGETWLTAEISIHAPLTGSDLLDINHDYTVRISIHAPLTGSDRYMRDGAMDIFDFNPRSPYGERLVAAGGIQIVLQISIHAPLTGSDAKISFAVKPYFISIHAPLTGSDILGPILYAMISHFNPRSPYGERLITNIKH